MTYFYICLDTYESIRPLLKHAENASDLGSDIETRKRKIR